MMKNKCLFIFGLLLISLSASSAFAGGVRFNLLGTSDLSQNSGATSAIGYGAGGSLEFKMGSAVGIEAGFIYTFRNMTQMGLTHGIYGDIPLVFRFYFGNILSIGLGGFYELPMDSVMTSYYGVTADITIRAPLGPKAAFILRPRYSYDLVNTGSNQLNFLSGIAGFQFGM